MEIFTFLLSHLIGLDTCLRSDCPISGDLISYVVICQKKVCVKYGREALSRGECSQTL